MGLALGSRSLVLATLLLGGMCLQIGHRVVWVDSWRGHLNALTSRLIRIIAIVAALILLLGLALRDLNFGRSPTGYF